MLGQRLRRCPTLNLCWVDCWFVVWFRVVRYTDRWVDKRSGVWVATPAVRVREAGAALWPPSQPHGACYLHPERDLMAQRSPVASPAIQTRYQRWVGAKTCLRFYSVHPTWLPSGAREDRQGWSLRGTEGGWWRWTAGVPIGSVTLVTHTCFYHTHARICTAMKLVNDHHRFDCIIYRSRRKIHVLFLNIWMCINTLLSEKYLT